MARLGAKAQTTQMRHAGGWRNPENGPYCFDSTRLFPEDRLDALRFGRENGPFPVYILSTGREVAMGAEAPA